MIPLASPTLFLYGPPATGKSTCAQNLAVALAKSAIDLDTLIEQRLGMSIPKAVEQFGQHYFRDTETAVLRDLCNRKPNAVVALGGGALLRDENRKMAEACGPIVCLHTPPEILAKRVERKAGSRPFSKTADSLLKLLEDRREHYASFPLSIHLSGEQMPQEVWPKVMAKLGRFIVSGMGAPYPVLIAPDAVAELPRILERLDPKPAHLLIIGDSNTIPLYAQRIQSVLNRDVPAFEIPAGEEHKTLATVSKLWEAMGNAQLERNDLVIALGGGVTGDLTGFAASAWLRGIRWLNLPTTLLAMVDAGIGGKTGADLPSGKNLIGAFHPPCAVLADTTTLATLSERDIRCGLAETLKHAVIGDPELLEMLNHFAEKRTDIDWLTHMVIRSAGVKIRTILEDPFERTGRRAALNLGHTIGHAVEAASGFTIAHGEAVAIGTVAAARLAGHMKIAPEALADTLKRALSALGLPTEIPDTMDAETLYAYLLRDKKKTAGKVRFALPYAVGNVKTGIIIPEQDLYDLLERKRF
ncbi:MAG: 3-dehydroquinate synthase [Kiritimatiellae bacterium]|nr:3-dehydroquinate synthase [Kiritimatiellia bacterium]